MTTNTIDYPFTKFNDFIGALATYLSTEFYMETYPNFGKVLDDTFDHENFMMDIVKELYDPKDSTQFSEYIHTFVNHPRYAMELSRLFLNIVHFYVQKSKEDEFELIYNIMYLLDPEYDLSCESSCCATFEDEVSNYHVRGLVINTLISENFCSISDFSSYKGQPIDWRSFEDIDTDDDINENGDKTDYTDEMRFHHLRMYVNHFLQMSSSE